MPGQPTSADANPSPSPRRSFIRVAGLRPVIEFTILGHNQDEVVARLQTAIPDTRPPGSVTWGGQPNANANANANADADANTNRNANAETLAPSLHRYSTVPHTEVRVRWAGSHAIVALPEQERQLWSPWLFIEVEPVRENAEDPDSAAGNHVKFVETSSYEDSKLNNSFNRNNINSASQPTAVRISGRLSPAPGLWVGYALFLIAASAVAGLGLCITAAQWTIGTPIWGLWLVLVAGLFAVILLSIAVLGQRATRAQMERLETLLEDAVKPLQKTTSS